MKKIIIIIAIIFIVIIAALVGMTIYSCKSRNLMVWPSVIKCSNFLGNKISGIPEVKPFVSDKLRVNAPLRNSIIDSPLQVRGEARGSWFFEASFPIRLVDENGKEIAVTHAQATKDWMTNDFVPFEATLRFETPKAADAILVFENDNPSGRPESAEKVEFPVRFERKQETVIDSGVTGKVLSGPTCPVERIPPDPKCAPMPYPTLIEIFKKDNPEKPYVTIKTDDQAYFRAELEAGIYIFQPTSDNRYPFCKPQEEEVLAHQFRDITLACDTGIR